MTVTDEEEATEEAAGGNYATALTAYKAAGWRGVLPLPPLAKSPPPRGCTGADGRWPSRADEVDWSLTRPPDCNIALRLPPDVIGLDVDQYGQKTGYDNLLDAAREHDLPALPMTWRTSARDFPSGILFYQVPWGVKLRGEAVADVETIQYHHRFAIVWPSVHPKTHTSYLWWPPSAGRTSVAMRVPSPLDLAELPPEWLIFLEDGNPTALPASLPPAAEHREAGWAPATGEALGQALGALQSASAGSRHGVARDGALRLLRLEQGASAGATTALDDLGRAFVNLVADDRGGLELAIAEWHRILEGGRRLAQSSVTVAQAAMADERANIAALTGGGESDGSEDGPMPPAPSGASLAPESLDDPCAVARLDWSTFWRRDRSDADFLAEPLLARGRSHAIYAGPKVGKSLLMLEVAAACATGRPVLDQPGGDAVSVLYFDLEMTEDDVYERLSDLGYGPESDLTRFHYYLLPTLPPLDSLEGGEVIERIARHRGAALAIFDTTSRVIAGPENDADTFRAFYRCTGSRLKRLGVTYARLDHSGKDPEKGQRGSSAKADDVDVVWQVTSTDSGLKLKATHRRVAWVPESAVLARQVEPLRHVLVAGAWPQGTAEVAKRLDALGIPPETPRRATEAALREADGKAPRSALLSAAIRWRRERENHI